MARTIALTIRVTEDEAEYLEHLGLQSKHGKTMVAYMFIEEGLEVAGIKDFIKNRDGKLPNKK